MPGEPPGSSDPLDPDGLVGRAAEAAAIRRMLDGAPLVTVTGLPGVGKTAVSLAAARAAAADSADGSLLLRLDRLRDEALLTHTIAAALRLPDQYTRSASTCWSISCATGTCCSSWTRANTCSARAPRWPRRCCRPDETTCIPPASPESLFAYRFDDLKFYVVDSGFVVD